MKQFWRRFRRYLLTALIAPWLVFGLPILRWCLNQIVGTAVSGEIEAWARGHNVASAVLTAIVWAESHPDVASIVLAAFVVAYGALRSEYNVQRHLEEVNRTSISSSPVVASSASIPVEVPDNHPEPNIVYARQEVGLIDDPIEPDPYCYKPVDALLLAFRNAPTQDHAITTARTVSASITYVKIATRAMLEEELRMAGEDVADRPPRDPNGCFGIEEVLVAPWRTNIRVNEVSFEPNSIRDLIVMFRRDGRFFALEDQKAERPYSHNHTPELTEGRWTFRVRFAIDGKLDGQSHYFRFFSHLGSEAELHVTQGSDYDWPSFLRESTDREIS